VESDQTQEWDDLDKEGDPDHAIFLSHIEELKVQRPTQLQRFYPHWDDI
jgi:hypothetical protein